MAQSLSLGESGLHPADAVWRLASDGRWHTRIDLERQVPYEQKTVRMAIDFLVKYGFLEPTPMTGMLRVIAGTGSPTQVIDSLLQMIWTGLGK